MTKKVLHNRSEDYSLEGEMEEGVLKVTEDFINKLRALAKKQKAEASIEEFTKILGNNGKDVPKPTPDEAQINAIVDELEIEEE